MVIRDGIVGGQTPPKRRVRARRVGGAILAAVGAAALAALMVVLILAGGGPDRPPAPTTATYRATSYAGGPTVSRATLEETSRLLNERAAAIGHDDTHARLTEDGEIALSAPSATAEELSQLTAVGRLAIYPRERAFVGDPEGTLAGAVRAAQTAAKAPVTGTGIDALPPGFAIIRDIVSTPTPPRVRFQAVRGAPALTEADVAAARIEQSGGEVTVALDFTPEGEAAFEQLTRTLAQDGALQRRLQSFAVVVDDTLITSPTLDYTQFPAGIDGRNGLGIEIRPPLDAHAIAARLASGPLPLQLARTDPRPSTPAQAGVERIYLGVACPRADETTCDRVGLSVSLRDPAMAIRATLDGRAFALEDPSWSGPTLPDGSRRLFAGFLDPAGLNSGALALPDSPTGGRWIGDPPVSASVHLEIERPNGTTESVEEVIDLRPGWG
jgi:hypothetical protein